MKNLTLMVAATAGLLALTGCVAQKTPAKPITTPVSTQAPPQPTPTQATPHPTSTALPAPSPTPPTSTPDYTVLGFDAQQLWDACQVAVAGQYTYIDADYPGITKFRELAADSVRDAQEGGAVHVAVYAPSALIRDGKPMTLWVCEFSGEPAAPHLEHASFADR